MLSNALSLEWAYGFSKDKINGTVSLCQKDRNALFLMSSHSGVIYDFEHRTQTILQGHCNVISCCVVDKNKRWIVTADTGVDPIMVVWDAVSFVPVKTYAVPHEGGVEALDISDDSLFIASLGCPTSGSAADQELAIWAWTAPENEAILRQPVGTDDYQFSVKIDLVDHTQVVTTGDKSVLFWRWDDFALTSYSGRVSKTDLGNFGGDFVTTIFLPSTENALTATSEGFVVVWESNTDEDKEHVMGLPLKEATKVLKLVDCGINILTTTANDYLVVACTDGAVRFYDYFLRLEAWFEDINAGPLTSISFSVQDCPFPYGEAGAPGLKFWVPDFIVGTTEGFVVGVESSLFDEVRKDDRRGTLLMQGMSDEVTSVSCHPTQPLVVIACANGVLQVWNYEMKLLMILREFNAGGADKRSLNATKNARNTLRPRSTAFDPTGKVLAVGFTSGQVKLLYTDNLEDISSYAPSSESIECVKFSPSGMYLAAHDSGRHVLLFKKEDPKDEAKSFFNKSTGKPNSPRQHRGNSAPSQYQDLAFTYIGRARSHTAAIKGLAFGYKENVETMMSVSEDQYCVEYDLAASSVAMGVMCVKSVGEMGNDVCSHRIEFAHQPTAIMWHPKIDGDVEDRFVIANNAFKLKEFNLDSKQCRRTSLAPRFGNPPSTLLPVPHAMDALPDPELNEEQVPREPRYFAFSTGFRVVGLSAFPLTGDPSATMGIVAHPGEVTCIDVTNDGRYVFSAGGPDLSVNMWRIDTQEQNAALAQQQEEVRSGKTSMQQAEQQELAPFFALLEGGEGGELHTDLVDYFYYCQLRHLGEDSMEPRNLAGEIPLDEMPSLFRSVGYYPSEEEVGNVINEVRYKTFVNTGETQEFVGLCELVRLYLNHRPALPLDRQLIGQAFEAIAAAINDSSDPTLAWETLKESLTVEGEPISEADLDAYFCALTGAGTAHIPQQAAYDAHNFAEQLLGFEDFAT